MAEPPSKRRLGSFFTTKPVMVVEDDRTANAIRQAEDTEDGGYHTYLGATISDVRDMDRMGKVQELRRNFRPWSALSFVVLVQATWEYLLVATTGGLIDGGLAGLFWSYIWSFFGMGLIMASLAELASMAPTAAGQYHWVSEFAPPKWQKFLSHQTGWIATLAWQTGNATGPFVAGTLIQAMICVAYPDYNPTNWQATLIIIGTAILLLAFNIFGGRAAPLIQNLMFTLHIMGFWIILICFWTLSPRNTPDVVFTDFSSPGNWSSVGLSLMVGQVSAIFSLTASDAAAHIAEEVKDAGTTVPQAIVRSYLLNGLMGVIMLVSFLFCITSLEDALNDDTGYPLIWVLKNTVSDSMLLFLVSVIFVLIMAGTAALNISTTRQTWAFARDAGIPCHKWFAKVCPTYGVPVNSCLITCGTTIGLSLINVGSSTAFSAIISLNIVALMITYIVSITCVLYRKLRHPETLPKHRWTLGKWGIPINVAALVYSSFAFFWCFWPQDSMITTDNFNWSIVMFAGTVACGLTDYWFRGRREYKGPATLVTGWKGR